MKTLSVFVIGLLTIVTFNLKATTYTAIKNGQWSSSSTWSPSGTPGASDTYIIPSSITVTSSAKISIGTSSGGGLTINSGGELDLGSNKITLDDNASATISGTLIAGYLELNSSSSITNSGTVTISSGLKLDNNTTFTNTGTVNAGTLELNSTSAFTDNGSMTVTTSIALDNSSNLTVGTGITLNDNGSFDDYSSTGVTDNGAILVSGTATFYGGTSISGTGYLTGGEIQEYHNTTVWGVPASHFPCYNCTIPYDAPLPISLISFTAVNNTDAVLLQWSTATETNNSYFTLARSTDGVNFTPVTTVNGAGNSTETHNYSYTDLNAANGINYYRLQQTDYDGTTVTAGMTAVTVNLTDKTVKIIPNPVKDHCVVSFNDNTNENFQLTLFDCVGREVATQNIQAFKGLNTVELNISTLSQGMYFVSLPVNGSTLKTRFIKQ